MKYSILAKKVKKHFLEPHWWMLPILIIICGPCLIIHTWIYDSKWFCTFWGWHKGPISGYNGFERHESACYVCKEEVSCDGQGNLY